MSTTTLPNIRVSSDLTVRVRLKDGGVYIDWSTLNNIKAHIYSDAQRALAGRCDVSVDAEDSTLLVCSYAANKPQYVGINRIVVSAKYMGETKTYDKPAFNFVRWTADQEGEEITIDDPDVDVEIEVEDVTSSILQEAIDAALQAAADAEHAAHLVPLEVLQDCEQATADAIIATAAANAAGIDEVQATVDAQVGTPSVDVDLENKVLSLDFHNMKGETGEAAGFGTASASLTEDGGDPGVTVSASGSDTAKQFAFTFKNLKGDKGDKGDQGNSGYTGAAGELEVVNNLTDGGAAKALSAEMGKTLEGEVSQLEAKVDDLSTGKYYGYFAKEEDLPEADVDGFAYVGEGPTYTIYNLRGGVWTSSDITVNQSPVGNDEDIDQNEDGKLQFANRVYNAQQPNGMGYKILRADKTFASQVTAANTIYEIRYDFDLNNATVTIPAGCVLKFNGGKLGNGTLVGNLTSFIGEAVKIFQESMSFSGSFNVPRISTDMFVSLTSDNALRKLIALSSSDAYNYIEINDNGYPYYFAFSTFAEEGLSIKSNTDICINGVLRLRPNALTTYEILRVYNCKNVHIWGVGSVIGDKEDNTGNSEYGHCIQVINSDNITVEGLTFESPAGDGLSLCYGRNYIARNITVRSVKRNGFSVVNVTNATIENCEIDGVSGTAPQSGIDIEPNSNENNRCVTIRNVVIKNTVGYGITGSVQVNTSGYNGLITIDNCRLENTTGVGFSNTSQVAISNVDGGNGILFFSNCSDISITNSIFCPTSNDCSINNSQRITIHGSKFDMPSVGFYINASEISFERCHIKCLSLYNSASANHLLMSGCTIYAGFKMYLDKGSILWNNYMVFDKTSGYSDSFFIRVLSVDSSGDIIFINNIIDIAASVSYIFNISGACKLIGNNIRVESEVTVTNVFFIVAPIQYVDNEVTVSDQATVSYKARFYDQAIRDNSKVGHTIIAGSTSARPSFPAISNMLYNVDVGSLYYDTTLGKMTVWNGTAWVNMDGTALS